MADAVGVAGTAPVECVLIEKRSDRVQHLTEIVRQVQLRLLPDLPVTIRTPLAGDCEIEVHRLIDNVEEQGEPLGPCFAFLDQFGYGEFSIDLIGRILGHKRCETLSFLNWRMMHPWLTDPTKAAPLTRGFGSEVWQELIDLRLTQKEEHARDLYEAALRERCGAKHVYPFTMRGHDGQISYWLFFCTNNIRGLEEMKEAMWAVDATGSFSFSDKGHETTQMFAYSDDDLRRDLTDSLNGKELTVSQLHEHVLTKTPAYQWKQVAAAMERDGLIEAVEPPNGRRRGSFADSNIRLRFRRQSEGQQNLFVS